MAKHIDKSLILILIGMAIVCCIIGFAMTKVEPTRMLMVTMAIVVLIVCFVWPPIALYLLIFSMLLSPEFGQRGTQGEGFTLRLDDILLMLVSFSWFANAAIHPELGWFPSTPVNKVILGYLLICILSTLVGGFFGKIKIIGFVFIFKYFEYFVVFFMAINFIQNKKQAKTFVTLLLITYGIICLYALSQIPSGERISAPFEGTEGEPGTLAGYLMLMMSVSIGVYLTSESKWLKRLLLVSIVLAVLCIAATGSRGAWMGLPALILCFLVLSKKRLIIIGVLAVLLAASPFLIPSGMKERYSGTFETERGAAQLKIGGRTMALDSSTSERVNSWFRVLGDLKHHPFIGYGVTGYGFIDSQYFKTLIELGLIGFSIFVYFLYRVFRLLLDSYHLLTDRFEKGVTMGLIAGYTALLVHAIGANTFILVRVMEPFWFLLGIVYYWYHTAQEENKALENESLNTQNTAQALAARNARSL